MMWPHAVMKYWQAVRRAYSAANPSAIHPSVERMTSGGSRKNCLVKKFRNCGKARSTAASTEAHTRSKKNRNL